MSNPEDQVPQQRVDGSPVNAPLPAELRDAVEDLKVGIPANPLVSESEKISSLDVHSGGDAQEFACHIHSYLRQFIEFSDKKAGFTFAVDAAVLIYLYQDNAHSKWLKSITTWSVNDLSIFTATLLMFLGAIVCANVIVPRLTSSHRGFVFFSSISEYNSANEYASTIFRQAKLGLTEALLKHDYDLASICKKKYRLLVLAMRLSMAGVVLAIIALILSP